MTWREREIEPKTGKTVENLEFDPRWFERIDAFQTQVVQDWAGRLEYSLLPTTTTFFLCLPQFQTFFFFYSRHHTAFQSHGMLLTLLVNEPATARTLDALCP